MLSLKTCGQVIIILALNMQTCEVQNTLPFLFHVKSSSVPLRQFRCLDRGVNHSYSSRLLFYLCSFGRRGLSHQAQGKSFLSSVSTELVIKPVLFIIIGFE